MDALQSTLAKRRDDVPSGFNQLQRKQWQESFQKTLAAFVEARKRAQQQQMWQRPPLISHGGDFMAHFKSYADSHWIIGEGVAFDLKPEEISRLREEGRLYDPDAVSRAAPIDGRNWIAVSSLIIAAVLVGLFLTLRRLRRKFE